uniref:DNA/RNA-binding protein Alba-like domain-containing protein n=2 Tax=Aegilops tauschii subsp. strangulata TaxID=200361 RepID=A0A453HBW5_AEGTS
RRATSGGRRPGPEMDRYQRVERPRPESAIAENEIRITAQGLIRNYVSYATSLLQDRKIKEIVLKAMGQAISKSVAVTEIIKKRVPGLYQDTNISSVSITDVWEPIEEGLVPLEMTRHVSMISITLSPVDLDQNSPGYQSPAYVDQPRQQQRLQQAPAPLRQPRQQPSDYDGMIVIVRTCFCTSVVQTYHDCCSVRLLCEGSWQRKGPWTW